MKRYRQCTLRREGLERTAWIELRGARVGAEVELLPSGEFWRVVDVFEHVLTEDVLKETQRLNRRSLPSVEAIA